MRLPDAVKLMEWDLLDAMAPELVPFREERAKSLAERDKALYASNCGSCQGKVKLQWASWEQQWLHLLTAYIAASPDLQSLVEGRIYEHAG